MLIKANVAWPNLGAGDEALQIEDLIECLGYRAPD